MELSYCECSVKRADRKYKVIKFLWILTNAYLLLINLFLIPSLTLSIIVLISIMTLVVVWPNFSAEYEYVFCDGQIDFDIIRSGRKRKTLEKIDLINAELVCGIYDEDKLNKYNNKSVRKKNFFSGMNYKGAYYIIIREGSQFARIGFEPDEKMLQCIKNKKPRITYIYEEVEYDK